MVKLGVEKLNDYKQGELRNMSKLTVSSSSRKKQ